MYAIWECLKKSERYAAIRSQRIHFITLKTNHQIKKLLLQKFLSLVCYLRMSQKKLSCHFVTTHSFCHFLNLSLNQKLNLQKLLMMVCYLKMCQKEGNLSGDLFTKQSFCLRHIKGLFEAFLTVIRGISQGYIGNFSALSWSYIRHK